jgi:gamma-carbonic anhydrase
VLIEHDGRRPTVDPSAWVAPTAVLSGDVRIGPGCRVLFGAVLTDDGAAVELADHVIVMENALIRGRGRYPARVGRHHRAARAHQRGRDRRRGVHRHRRRRVPRRSARRASRSQDRGRRARRHDPAQRRAGADGWVEVGDPAQKSSSRWISQILSRFRQDPPGRIDPLTRRSSVSRLDHPLRWRGPLRDLGEDQQSQLRSA